MISVITPTYNCAEFIMRSYACLNSQTYEDWEWLVVDDGSLDETSKIFNKLIEKDSRIKFFRYEENKGRGFARNFALEKSNGEFLAIWDIDDLYTSNRLELINKYLQLDYDYFCSYILLANKKRELKGARHFFKTNLDSIYPIFTHATLAFKRKHIQEYGLSYDPQMRAGEDLYIMLNLQNHLKGYFCEEYLMIYIEDREVNLKKAIQANKSHYETYKNFLDENHFDFKIKSRFLMDFFLKLAVLHSLRLKPSLYLKTVGLRNNDFIKPEKLNFNIINLLQSKIYE